MLAAALPGGRPGAAADEAGRMGILRDLVGSVGRGERAGTSSCGRRRRARCALAQNPVSDTISRRIACMGKRWNTPLFAVSDTSMNAAGRAVSNGVGHHGNLLTRT